MEDINKFFTIDQAAQLMHLSRIAIYMAIRKSRLKAFKKWIHFKNGSKRFQWKVTLQDLNDYSNSRYSKKFSKYKDEPLFDKAKGEHSVAETSKILNVPPQWVYHRIRTKRMVATKKNAAWIINISEIEKRQVEKQNLADKENEC